ncbi:sugar kinase [Rodentibacter caecimuris]|uniref:Sugar kinase n=1 Tax=Rodentibacter caecimuris TaxID=1796644 RepID=A0A1V3KQS8_9PAST|nr:ROK family protein [Rodentibacter heylii]OOF79961.1 sugar kinase [Rodentibacter heylii]
MTNPILSLRTNERLLLRLIRQHSPSRRELSQLSGLTPGAITQYCRKLLFLGLIRENEMPVKKRGQPSFHLSLNPTGCCSIGIAFLTREFSLSLVDFTGKKIANVALPYRSLNDLDELLIQVKQAIRELLEKKFLTEARILGVGISVSGVVFHDESRSSPWFPLLQNQPNLTALFEKALAYPCYIENNINTLAISEYYSGRWNKVNDIIVISLDFGIGAGIISHGKLIHGAVGNAGEVGALFPNHQPRPTWKNLRQQFEEEPSEKALKAMFEQRHPKLEAWFSHAKPQVLSLILSAIAWFDPNQIVITGMLPTYIIDELIKYAQQSELLQSISHPIATLSTNQISVEDISIGAAILPIYRLLQGS